MSINTREFELLKDGPERDGYRAGWGAAMQGMPCEVPPPRGHDCEGQTTAFDVKPRRRPKSGAFARGWALGWKAYLRTEGVGA